MAALTNTQKRKAIQWDYAGNAFNSVFVEFTVFGTIFIIFLDKLGIDKSQIGFLLSLFPFAGILALLITPYVENFGYKKTFIWFFGFRKLIVLGLVIIPLLIDRFSSGFIAQYILVIIGVFAILRAISETGFYPWNQEYVPSILRGKISANSSLIATTVSFISILVGSSVISFNNSLLTFATLMAIGVVFGLISVWCYSKIPTDQESQNSNSGVFVRLPNIKTVFSHRPFKVFLIGVGLFILATGPMMSFMPLYMKEVIGLSSAQTIQLQIGSKIGSLFFGLLWGWAADRYGSRPTTITGLLFIVFLPMAWLVLGFLPAYQHIAAFVLAILQGASFIAWQLGHSKLLFVHVVPEERKQDYLSFYYAFVGIVGGSSQILGGMLLTYLPDFSILGFRLSSYGALFLISIGLLICTILVFRLINEQKSLSVSEFLKFFLYGNSLQAFGSLLQYNWMIGERKTVKATEKLGASQSHLTVNELLHALDDPRFQVRYEAITAMAKSKPNIKLVKALGTLLEDRDPALSVPAAWALGRLGDSKAISFLEKGLDSEYQSVKIQSVRSLAYLRAEGYEKQMLQSALHEKDWGLLVAYCSYLGKLRYKPAIKMMLYVFDNTDYVPWRKELVLSLSRVLYTSKRPIKLYKETEDPGTNLSMNLEKLVGRLSKKGKIQHDEKQLYRDIAIMFSQDNWALAAESLPATSETLPEHVQPVYEYCVESLHKNPKSFDTWVLWICCLPSED